MEQYARGHFEKCVINEAYPFLFYELPKFGKSAFHGIVSKNRLLKEMLNLIRGQKIKLNDLYELLLEEFPDWLKVAQQKNIVQN